MTSSIELIKTGISFIDNAWGGFYGGGAYFLAGNEKSGKTSLAVQFASQISSTENTCLYFTSIRPRNLMIHSSSMGMNIQPHLDNNNLIVIRVAQPRTEKAESDHDAHLNGFFEDIISITSEFKPSALIFDELTPYTSFKDQNLFQDTFMEVIEFLEDNRVTSLFVFQKEAASAATPTFDLISKNSTGNIELIPPKNRMEQKKGVISISPNIGHSEGAFSAEYSMIPNHQILFHTHKTIEKPNFYDFTTFLNKLGEKLELVKKKKSTSNLFMFRVDSQSRHNQKINIEQLERAVRVATRTEDINCLHDDTLYIYTSRNQSENLNGIFALSEQLEQLLKHVTVTNLEINDTFENAEHIIQSIDNNILTHHNQFLNN